MEFKLLLLFIIEFWFWPLLPNLFDCGEDEFEAGIFFVDVDEDDKDDVPVAEDLLLLPKFAGVAEKDCCCFWTEEEDKEEEAKKTDVGEEANFNEGVKFMDEPSFDERRKFCAATSAEKLFLLLRNFWRASANPRQTKRLKESEE